ncbi:DUF4864 domain-containing protein [Fulvivirgaceae bacterium BMA12]|uniref:DUF4864 domain-containing protein n=1 Tax=Agaribacillus aureus TaxID=3051825 RepID=A0ABT8L2U7_9BACT|nr:DUF4864 domain-containing protein [Fulvivirgaceae bacterium BMA12]
MSVYLSNAQKGFFLCLLLNMLLSCRYEVIRTSDQPRQDLSPEEVVVSQLVALQTNDQPVTDHGITVAFAFASPQNKSNTGPMARFKAMLKSDTYRPLIDHREYKVSKHFIEKDKAQFFVEIISKEHKTLHYLFDLSRVDEAPYQGFWMTASVIPIQGKLDNPHNDPVRISYLLKNTQTSIFCC